MVTQRDALILLGIYLVFGLLVTVGFLVANSFDEDGPRYSRWLIPVGVVLWPLVALGSLVAVCWGLTGEER